MIAKHTGWEKDYILWDLDAAWGNALCHAFMRLRNVATQWSDLEKTKAERDLIDAL